MKSDKSHLTSAVPTKTLPPALAGGALRVWWIPQIPGKPFRVAVRSPSEARFLLDALAAYDLFQLEQRIKPDFCNAGGLEFFEPGDGWCEWYDDKTGESIDEITFAAGSKP